MSFAYIGLLLVSIACLLLIDWRYKLAFWHDTRRAVRALAVSELFFIAWDIIGIAFGVFFRGHNTITLSITIVPQFPVEELLFLFLLCYLTLLVYNGASRRWPRTS